MIANSTLKFLDDLKNNNNREWFQANQNRYKEFKKEYKALAEAFIKEMAKHDATLEKLEFKDVSFRINRDIRFSKDKSPYKTNMGIWMCKDGKNTNQAGYYVHIENGASFFGGGVYWPDAADLKKIRREIDGFYEDLEDIVGDPTFKKIYGELERDEKNSLKTAPKGFEKDHQAIEYLKLKSFTATAKITDKDLLDKDFIQNTCNKLAALKPLVDFLNRGLTTEF
ncbi:DUF2461 domain-containing protein [Flavobacterium rhizosphaerae]|uniref:DUF2461 domain-containing protein n=1 Tax=Flavobacterium rhizosphaerae TaxID=3163298 RepID=A0ABW8Z2A9_9FLAO